MYKIHGFSIYIYTQTDTQQNKTKTNGYCSNYKKKTKTFFLNLLHGIEITTSKYTKKENSHEKTKKKQT